MEPALPHPTSPHGLSPFPESCLCSVSLLRGGEFLSPSTFLSFSSLSDFCPCLALPFFLFLCLEGLRLSTYFFLPPLSFVFLVLFVLGSRFKSLFPSLSVVGYSPKGKRRTERREGIRKREGPNPGSLQPPAFPGSHMCQLVPHLGSDGRVFVGQGERTRRTREEAKNQKRRKGDGRGALSRSPPPPERGRIRPPPTVRTREAMAGAEVSTFVGA